MNRRQRRKLKDSIIDSGPEIIDLKKILSNPDEIDSVEDDSFVASGLSGKLHLKRIHEHRLTMEQTRFLLSSLSKESGLWVDEIRLSLDPKFISSNV